MIGIELGCSWIQGQGARGRARRPGEHTTSSQKGLESIRIPQRSRDQKLLQRKFLKERYQGPEKQGDQVLVVNLSLLADISVMYSSPDR